MTESNRLQGLVPDQLRVRQSSIKLDSLEVMTDIGFHDFEVGAPQRLLITVEIWLEDVAMPFGDAPDAAWNYDYLRQEIRRISSEKRYNLQETLVHALFDRFAASHGVKALRIASAKPEIYPDARGVGVEIASFTGIAP